LAIAIVVPKEKIFLHAGVMQAFKSFLEAFNLGWAVKWLAGLAVFGALALLNTWIIGPSKGLLTSALNGELPRFTRYTNNIGSPVAILILQAFIGTALACILLFMPSVNSAYWVLNTMAAQLILLMYLLVFLSVIWLRYTQPNTPRTYKIPGGMIGIWLVAGMGILACVGSFLLGFSPPTEFDFGNHGYYPWILTSGIILFSAPPFICHWLRKRSPR